MDCTVHTAVGPTATINTLMEIAMLMPILAVKPGVLPNLSSVALETASAVRPQTRVPIAISGLQSDAVLKIMETLNRHFIGEAVLPPEALARLVETLARVLKFPPLPQESTLEFARRLAFFIETLPPEARQLAEKQLGLRALGIPAKALAEALRNPNGVTAARIVTVLGTAPQPTANTGSGPGTALQQAGAPSPVAGKPSAVALPMALSTAGAEIDALQATLKRTFGAEDDTFIPPRKAEAKKEEITLPEAIAGETDTVEEPPQEQQRPVQSRAEQPQQAMPNVESFVASGLILPELLAEAEVETENIEATPLPEQIEQHQEMMEPADIIGLADDERLVSDGRGLADVIGRLAEETVEALAEKLAETLKEFAEITAALPDTSDPAKAARVTRQLPADLTEAALLSEALLVERPEDEAKAKQAAAQAPALMQEQTPDEDKDAVRASLRAMQLSEEHRPELAVLARAADTMAARDVIPFAMLHYLPAATEPVPDAEENPPAFGHDEQQGSQENDEAPQQDMADEAEADVSDAMTDDRLEEPTPDDTADDEAYQLYIRMGGIL